MSLITRCPACGTMFKVVPDQLRISEGWVRCGHCSEVFDATAHLQAEAVAPTEPGGLAPSQGTAGAPAVPREPSESVPPEDAFPSSLTTEVGSSLPAVVPDSIQLREEAATLVEGPLDRPFVLQRVEDPVVPAEAARPAAAARAPEPDLHELSFVRAARRNEFWTSPPVRVLLLLLLLGLAATLAAQFALFDRDRLAATQPQLRPLLMMLCDQLNCSIRPPRQIESISIDNSSFNKLRPDTYRLNVTLKNQSAMEVAMPALELTLTDAQDQAVLRRVLLPNELQPPRAFIAAGGDWAGSMAIAVSANGAGSRVAGYRVLAFYP